MVQFNLQQRELTLKVVYYGPALSGKTTNLQLVHAMAPKDATGRLMTLETRDDRTLFFDLLPVFFRTPSGVKVKVKLLTVPGQVIHASTRRIVLQGADAVIFVADSQLDETEANKESFRSLQENLKANDLPLDIPMVIQFNKRDLPAVRSDAELEAFARFRRTPVYKAVAIRGEGVKETLEGLLTEAWRDIERRYGVADRLGLDRQQFLSEFFANWLSPRALAGRLP